MTWGEVLRHNANQFAIAIDQALSYLVCGVQRKMTIGGQRKAKVWEAQTKEEVEAI